MSNALRAGVGIGERIGQTMKQQCRETVQRAIGIVEGISWVSEQKTSEALVCVIEMLDGVLTAEEGADNEQRKAD